ncbi:MAG: hypothetical protein HY680_10345, partial [Chloroflexi bacterium]|nr:hypothetical protein [Chloroflexota bacterium]
MALRLQRRSSLVNDATPPTTLPPASEGASLPLPGDALARPEGRKAEAAPPRRGMLAALPVQRRRRVTVDIHDGVARVVLLRGLQVVAWGKATLPPGALVGEEATGDALPSTEQLRALLRDLCPRKARLVTSLPSSLCLIRELRLPRMAGRYLRQVVAAELLESVPFSQAEVDIAWRRQRAGRGYAVVAAVAPAQAVDLHVGLLRGAAARPRAAYPRPVALALACGLADGILLDLGSRSVELALVKNGVPQIQHQLDMPGPWDEDMSGTAALALAVEQMAAYGGEEDAASIGGLPVAITGEKALEQGIAESLEVALDREVRPVRPPVAYPDHVPV